MGSTSVLGLNGVIIFSSLLAYLLAQIIDIQVYAYIKHCTGERFLWLRNNASTLISQIVDTFTVNMIFLYWGLGMNMSQVIQIMIFSYCYKAFFSIANTPLLYLLVFLAKKPWNGHNNLFMRYVNIKKSRLAAQSQQ